MSNLPHIAKTQIATFPEVIALVVTDGAGTLLESVGELDGEALGAVHVVTTQAITRCGNTLGLGVLDHVTVTSGKRAWVIALHEQQILGVYVDTAKPIGAFEDKLERALRPLKE